MFSDDKVSEDLKKKYLAAVPINQATDILQRYFNSLKVVPEKALKVS
jgi:hypothetical protein